MSKYFSNDNSNIFVIQGLPPEMTSAAMARYSRSTKSIRETLTQEFFKDGEPNVEAGSILINRVVNQFGDESVAELEYLHVGIENISQIQAKAIENHRVGCSFIEQSSRYNQYDQKYIDPLTGQEQWKYLQAPEGIGQYQDLYVKVMDECFVLYNKAVSYLIGYFRAKFPKEDKLLYAPKTRKMYNKTYENIIKCAALDVARCLLPASTLTNVGIAGNARFFRHLVYSLIYSDDLENNSLGTELLQELEKIIPTFLIHKEPPRPINSIDISDILEITNSIPLPQKDNSLFKVTYIPTSLLSSDVFMTSILYPYLDIPFNSLNHNYGMLLQTDSTKFLENLVAARLSRRSKLGRGLEIGYPFTFEIECPFSEYRDLQRHRVGTQQRQLLTVDIGFVLPKEFNEIHLDQEAYDLVDRVTGLFNLVDASESGASEYCTLYGHKVRWMIGMNLAELQHLCELRTQVNGHPTYRAICVEIAKQAISREPYIAPFLGFVNDKDLDNPYSRYQEQMRLMENQLGGNYATNI